MSDLPLSHALHDGTDAEARPVFAEERRILGVRASSWPGIIAPLVIGILALAAWERRCASRAFRTTSCPDRS